MEDTETLDIEDLMAAPVELPPERPRKRRKFRKYPRPPEVTLEQKRELLAVQGGMCPICREELTLEEAVLDHSYRSSLIRGLLHRSPCNSGLGFFKDSPTRLRRALAYLRNPPAVKPGLGRPEVERTKS
jgi:Recombination endonuclease VII